MARNENRIVIDIDKLITNIKQKASISLKRRPKFVLRLFDANKLAGTVGDTVFLNSLYFSFQNGQYYVNGANSELLLMRLTHELVHMLSNNHGKSGIGSEQKYKYNSTFGDGYIFDYNTALNEGITQMFTENFLGKATSYFCDGYYDFKKVAQLLKYLFGEEVMFDSYFNNSGLLEKGMNDYCDGLFKVINKKLTLADYLSSSMPHIDIDLRYNADLKIEKDICRSLRNEIFDECIELIINNLIIPWIKNMTIEEVRDEVNKLLQIFDDNVTLKNKIMFFLMKGYKKEEKLSLIDPFKTDIIMLHLIGVNNNEYYEVLDDGSIIDRKTNMPIPYNEQLYEYFYSKIVSKNDWEMVERVFNNFHASSNVINISLVTVRTIKQRRMLMIALKQYMKKNNFVMLNDIDCIDNGDKIEINYVHEKLTMDDIIYLYKNYTFVCLPGDTSNLLQIVDKKTNRVLTSDSLIGKCRMAYKIASLGLASTTYQDKWNQFFDVASSQISSTGMIKKSSLYDDNPFLLLFNNGYGCEWFYDYMRRIPIEFDRVKQELYVSENEMNTSNVANNQENDKLSQLFSTFIRNEKMK